MKFLIVGAGTIGLTYGWLLSSRHDVTLLVRPQRAVNATYHFNLQDLRDKATRQFDYTPALTHSYAGEYDAVLVMVNRLQLAEVLPHLAECTAPVVFMLNHWDIDREVKQYLTPGRYLYGFPSQVGGGRDGDNIDAIVFDEGTVLGEADGASTQRLAALQSAFTDAGLAVEGKTDILDWLKVHYLQQSISAGALLKAGSYDAFAASLPAVREMVLAFREGTRVCEASSVNTKTIFPASMFRYPTFIVSRAMKGMFNKPETVKMVTGHMKLGVPEWIAGYYEVLRDGERLGVDMPVWRAYKPYVDEYCATHGLALESLYHSQEGDTAHGH